MPCEWQYQRIEEIAEKVGMGPFGSSILVSTFVADGIPVISGQHLHGSRLQDGQYNFITTEHAERLRNSNVFRGDVIFTHAGNIGQVAYIPESSRYERYVISQRQFYVRCDGSKIIPSFLVQYFKTPEGQHRLLANSTPSGVPSIAQPVTYLRRLEVPVPPLPEQRAIAHILGTLDDKIELNRRMNETLEAMARALFQSWFVNFDPVRAKAEGRDTGLPAHIADLFPDSFEESELGEIPKGWKVGTLGEVVEFAYGKALKDANRRPGGVPVYGSNGQVGWHDQRLVEGPGIVVGRKGNAGTVTWAPTDFFPIDTTFYVVPKSRDLGFQFLLYALQDHDLPSLGADSAVPGLNRNMAYMSQQMIPSPAVVRQFDIHVESVHMRLHAGNMESRTLADLRDALLPNLISGALRVKDAERVVEGVGV